MKVIPRILGTGACLALLVGASAALALDAAGEGRRVYLRVNCYGCHGGHGGGGMGPNFRSERPEAGDLREVIREGAEGGMPAYPTLTATDITNLGAYFKTLRTAAEPTFTHWWEAVPTQ